MKGCHTSKNLVKWTLIHPEGTRRRVTLCAEHRKPLVALWRGLKAPQRQQKPTHVYSDLSEIPRA